MPVPIGIDKQLLVQQAGELLNKKVYSVAELEEFRQKTKLFCQSGEAMLGVTVLMPDGSDPPKDLLDWVAFEKARVQAVKDALSKEI